jgi:hypothetical protein
MYDQIIFEGFVINGSDTYGDEDAEPGVGVKMEGNISLPLKQEFFQKKIDELNRFTCFTRILQEDVWRWLTTYVTKYWTHSSMQLL